MRKKQKISKRKMHHTRSTPSLQPFIFVRYSVVITIAIFLISGIWVYIKTEEKPRVLGASTILLADHGESDDGNGVPPAGIDSSSGNNSDNGGLPSKSLSPSNTQTVDCIGPDGKHFTASFTSCQALNQKWGNSNFNFTPLTTTQPSQTKPEIEIEPSHQPGPIQENNHPAEPPGSLDVQTQSGKGALNIETHGTQVELNRENSGEVKITAQQQDGTEVELKPSEALQKINDTLETEGVEISTAAANGFAIKKGTVEAETHFPLSVNPTTHILTVNTPGGKEDIAVLPDQAVKNVLQTGTLNTIENQATESGSMQKITLTQLNSQPVFQIDGVSNKRIFGIFNVSFAKTAFVSTQTGQVVNVDETLLNRILEAVSF